MMINNLKKILFIINLVLILGLGISTKLLYNQTRNQQIELGEAISNNKAYELENFNLKNKTIEFQFTIDQLQQSADSINKVLNETRKSLKIKDKELQDLIYLQSITNKSDTIFILDTLFRENVKLDTLIKDDYSSLYLSLEYPNLVAVDYSFKNECAIITSSKKETIYPPKKFFIARWFQKKHIVTETIVEEKNPYAEIKEFRSINIIK